MAWSSDVLTDKLHPRFDTKILSKKVRLIHQCLQYFNPLTPGTFCQKCIFWTFWWFLRAELDQISFNLVENALATRQLALLATRITFYHISLGMRKMDEKVTYVFRLLDF